MRKSFPEIVEAGRIRKGPYASIPGERFGAFRLTYVFSHAPSELVIMMNDVCRDSMWWEHVSVSLANRTPTWEEMCWVKDLFWSDDEVVVQYHPAKRDYVNCHPHCLHLWRPTRHKDKLPLPPPILVGFNLRETLGLPRNPKGDWHVRGGD
jgi:hypothetical protein